jgi:hypothetical protein
MYSLSLLTSVPPFMPMVAMCERSLLTAFPPRLAILRRFSGSIAANPLRDFFFLFIFINGRIRKYLSNNFTWLQRSLKISTKVDVKNCQLVRVVIRNVQQAVSILPKPVAKIHAIRFGMIVSTGNIRSYFSSFTFASIFENYQAFPFRFGLNSVNRP